jgi:hypothetical protein
VLAINYKREKLIMPIDTRTLLWLFPIVFMFHDFEEIILGEPWLRKHGGKIKEQVERRVPAAISRQIGAVLEKSAAELSLPVSLIFCLTFLAAFVAVEYGQYGFFVMASVVFFLHGFMHIGQAILFRGYIPAVISSVVFVIPYGLMLFPRLLSEGIVDVTGLAVSAVVAIVLTIPFILVMHKAGDYLNKLAVRILVG